MGLLMEIHNECNIGVQTELDGIPTWLENNEPRACFDTTDKDIFLCDKCIEVYLVEED
jgi:hypothetical protein